MNESKEETHSLTADYLAYIAESATRFTLPGLPHVSWVKSEKDGGETYYHIKVDGKIKRFSEKNIGWVIYHLATCRPELLPSLFKNKDYKDPVHIGSLTIPNFPYKMLSDHWAPYVRKVYLHRYHLRGQITIRMMTRPIGPNYKTDNIHTSWIIEEFTLDNDMKIQRFDTTHISRKKLFYQFISVKKGNWVGKHIPLELPKTITLDYSQGKPGVFEFCDKTIKINDVLK